MHSLQPAEPDGRRRVVLDTNVLLDALRFDNDEVRPIWHAVTGGQLLWLATERMLDELRHQCVKPFSAKHPAPSERSLTEACAWARRVDAAPALPATVARLRCRDADDQMFVELAWQHAAALISRDRDLLVLAPKARRLGLWIGTPSQFAPTLGAERSDASCAPGTPTRPPAPES